MYLRMINTGGFPNSQPFIFFKGGNDQSTIQHQLKPMKKKNEWMNEITTITMYKGVMETNENK